MNCTYYPYMSVHGYSNQRSESNDALVCKATPEYHGNDQPKASTFGTDKPQQLILFYKQNILGHSAQQSTNHNHGFAYVVLARESDDHLI